MQLPLSIQVATAGYVLGRLLLQPPPAALVQSLADTSMRATWPLSDQHSTTGLSTLSDGVGELGAIRFDYERLFTRGAPPPVALHTTAHARPASATLSNLVEVYRRDSLSVSGLVGAYDDHVALQLLYVADRASEAAQAERSDDAIRLARAHEAAGWVREHFLDPAASSILAGIREHAATPLMRALPDLVQGFLDEHRRSLADDGSRAD